MFFDRIRKAFQAAFSTTERPGRVLDRRPPGWSRRDFLRAMGVTSTTVAMGGMTGSIWKPEGLLTDPLEIKQSLSGETLRTLNETLFDKLASGDPALLREAADAVNAFTRVKMREDGFFRKILPPIPIPNYRLDLTGHVQKMTDELIEQLGVPKNFYDGDVASALILPPLEPIANG